MLQQLALVEACVAVACAWRWCASCSQDVGLAVVQALVGEAKHLAYVHSMHAAGAFYCSSLSLARPSRPHMYAHASLLLGIKVTYTTDQPGVICFSCAHKPLSAWSAELLGPFSRLLACRTPTANFEHCARLV